MDKLHFLTAGLPLISENKGYKKGLEYIRELGLDGLEVEFVHGVRMNEQNQSYVKNFASENDYLVTCHGPYYINLNSDEAAKELEKDGYSMNKVKALVINYPNNPLGATCTKEYLKHAVDFCKKHHILLISDAAYIDLIFEGSPKAHSVFEIEGAKDIAVEFYSFSKPYSMTGWRIGWICGNSEAVTVLGKLKSTIDTGIYKPIQKAAADILNSKEGDEYIVEANKRFERKQKIITDGLKSLGWPIDKINPPKATFYLWLPIPPKYKTSKEFTDELLNKSGIVVVPGNGFGKNGEGWFRLSIVAAEEQMHEVIRRMKEDGFRFE